MTEPRIAIDRPTIEPWIQAAQAGRMLGDTLSQVGQPQPGSHFEQMDELFPFEPPSVWVRGFLQAAHEHLLMWADYAIPLKFSSDAVVTHTLRPVQTLSRAAIESASQAIWVMEGDTARECTGRHLVLLVHDLEEQRKATPEGEGKTQLKQRRQLLIETMQPYVGQRDLTKVPGYRDLVIEATKAVASKARADAAWAKPGSVDRLWRASAGSAHGKRWPSMELQVAHTHDPAGSGPPITYRIPDPDAITQIVTLANDVFMYGVIRYAEYAGYEHQLESMMARSRENLEGLITRRDTSSDS